jgi:hypothetical protein
VLWPLIGRYVKEGLVMAPHHTNDLAPLLRYESSKLEEGQLTSLAEYAVPRAALRWHCSCDGACAGTRPA